jgi:hypothetical protein
MLRLHLSHHLVEQSIPWLIRGLAIAAFAFAAWAAWVDFTQL